MQKAIAGFVVWGALLAPAAGVGVEVSWLELKVMHTYRDKVTDCSAIAPGGHVFLAVEREGDRPLRAVLNNFPYAQPWIPIHQSVELDAAEIARITGYIDAKGRWWLRRLALSDRLLKWVLYHGSQGFSYCPLPQWPRTILPGSVDYEFDTEGIEAGILIGDTQKVAFTGTRNDGEPFRATMRLSERQHQKGRDE